MSCAFLKREAGDEEDKKKGHGKSSVSTKRSRAAAIHNQSERVCSLLLVIFGKGHRIEK